jgi:hypothetical protein
LLSDIVKQYPEPQDYIGLSDEPNDSLADKPAPLLIEPLLHTESVAEGPLRNAISVRSQRLSIDPPPLINLLRGQNPQPV